MTMLTQVVDGRTVELSAEETAVVLAEWNAPPSAAVLAAYTADKRYQVETGGISVEGVGRVGTDRSSYAKLMAEMAAISSGLRAKPAPWKLADGTFALLSNDDMRAVIVAVRQHVAQSFLTESEILEGIASGSVTSVDQIKAADWPPNVGS